MAGSIHSEDEKNLNNDSEQHPYKDETGSDESPVRRYHDVPDETASHATSRRSSRYADSVIGDNESAGFTPFELDDDVVSRIRSLSSAVSDHKRINELKELYPDGFVKMSLESPERAMNFTFKQKILHTMGYGFTTLSAQMGASILSASALQIAEEFHVGTEISTLAFCVYVLGNIVGPPIFAPMSEIYGRKIGVFIPCFIGGVMMCISANVTSIAALVVLRFVAGAFCAAPVVSSGGAMADLWSANERAAALVLYAISIVAGAEAAPVIGALLSTTGSYGWRWSMWLTGLLCMTVSVVNLWLMTETFFPVVEQSIVKNERLESGFWGLHCEQDKWRLSFDEFVHIHLLRPILMLITPIIFLFVIYASFVYGLVFLLITSVSVQFETVHHFTHVTGFLPLFALFTGFVMGGGLNIIQSMRFSRIAARIGRKPEPEERLPCMMLFGWFIPCGMFIYGWTMKKWIHWIVPCVGLGFVGAGMAVIFQGCLIYMVDVYTKYSASAIAANTIMRSVFGGVFPLFALQMFKGMGVHWASSLLGFVGLALCPVPWMFRFYGARIREHDPYRKQLT